MELELHVRSGDLPCYMESHLAKYRSLVPSLALLIHLAENIGQRYVQAVELSSLQKAIAWSKYLQSHAGRIYGASVGQADIEAAERILQKIKDGDLADGFTLNQVARKQWSGLTDRKLIGCALQALEEHHWIRSERIAKTKGRSKIVYHVRPA